MHDDEPIVVESAGRHGVDQEDALHAWANAIDVWLVDEGMARYVGPDRTGLLLEVGVVDWHGRSPSCTPCQSARSS